MTSSVNVYEKKRLYTKSKSYSNFSKSKNTGVCSASNLSSKKIGEKSKHSKSQLKEWEAARRKRFNEVLDALLLELPNPEPCSKMEIVQRALAFVKEHKLCNLSGDNPVFANGVFEKLQKQNGLLSHVLKEAGVLMKVNKKREVTYVVPMACDKNCLSKKKKKVIFNLSTSDWESENVPGTEDKSMNDGCFLDKEVQTEKEFLSHPQIIPFPVAPRYNSILSECNRKMDSIPDENNASNHITSNDALDNYLSVSANQEEMLRANPHLKSCSAELGHKNGVKEQIVVEEEERNGAVTVNILSEVEENEDPLLSSVDTNNSQPPIIMQNLPGSMQNVLSLVRVPKQQLGTAPSISSEASGNQAVYVQDLKLLCVMPKLAENSANRLVKVSNNNNAKMFFIKCKNDAAKNSNQTQCNILVPQIPEPHVTIVTPSHSHAPIMSTGLATTLSQKRILVQANPNVPYIFNAYTNPPPNRLKRIAPKPSKENDNVSHSLTKLLQTSPKKQTPNFKIVPKVQYKRKKSEEDILIPQVSRAQKGEVETMDNPLEPSLPVQLSKTTLPDAIDDLKELPTNSLTEHVHNSGMSDSEPELDNMIDLPVDMRCVIPETMRGSEVTEDKLVEMLRSMDEEDRQCSFSLSSDSLPKFCKKQDSSSKLKENVLSVSEDTEKVSGSKSSLDSETDKNRILPSTIQSVSDISVGSSNYSIMSLCMSSKVGDVIGNIKNGENPSTTPSTEYQADIAKSSSCNKVTPFVSVKTSNINVSQENNIEYSRGDLTSTTTTRTTSTTTTTPSTTSTTTTFTTSISTTTTSAAAAAAATTTTTTGDSNCKVDFKSMSTLKTSLSCSEPFRTTSHKSDLSVSSLISHPVIQTDSFGLKSLDPPLPLIDLPTTSVPPSLVPPSIFLPPHPFPTPPIPPIPPIGLASLTLPGLPSTHHSSSVHNYPLSTSTSTTSSTIPLSVTQQSKCVITPISCSSSSALSDSCNHSNLYLSSSNTILTSSEKTKTVNSQPISSEISRKPTSKLLYSCPISTSQSLKLPFSLPTVPSLPILTTIPSSTDSSSINKSIFSLTPISSYAHPFPFCALSLSDAPTTFSFTLTRTSSSTSCASVRSCATSISAKETTFDSVTTSKTMNAVQSSSGKTNLHSYKACTSSNSFSGLSHGTSSTYSVLPKPSIPSLTTSSSSLISTSSDSYVYSMPPGISTLSPIGTSAESQSVSKDLTPPKTSGTNISSSHKTETSQSKNYSMCPNDSISTKPSITSTLDFSSLGPESASLKTLNRLKDTQKQKPESHEFKLPLLPLSTYLDSLGTKDYDFKAISHPTFTLSSLPADSRYDCSNMTQPEASSVIYSNSSFIENVSKSADSSRLLLLKKNEMDKKDKSPSTVATESYSKTSFNSIFDNESSCVSKNSQINSLSTHEKETLGYNNSKSAPDKPIKEVPFNLNVSLCSISKIFGEDDKNCGKEKLNTSENSKDKKQDYKGKPKSANSQSLLQDIPLDFRSTMSITVDRDQDPKENTQIVSNCNTSPVSNALAPDETKNSSTNKQTNTIFSSMSNDNLCSASISNENLSKVKTLGPGSFDLSNSNRVPTNVELNDVTQSENKSSVRSTTNVTSKSSSLYISTTTPLQSEDCSKENYDGQKMEFRTINNDPSNKNLSFSKCAKVTSSLPNAIVIDNQSSDLSSSGSINKLARTLINSPENKQKQMHIALSVRKSPGDSEPINKTNSLSTEAADKHSETNSKEKSDVLACPSGGNSFQAKMDVDSREKQNQFEIRNDNKVHEVQTIKKKSGKNLPASECMTKENHAVHNEKIANTSNKISQSNSSTHNPLKHTSYNPTSHQSYLTQDVSNPSQEATSEPLLSSVHKPTEALQRHYSKEHEQFASIEVPNVSQQQLQSNYQSSQPPPPPHHQVGSQQNMKQCQGQGFTVPVQQPTSVNQMQPQLHHHQHQQQQLHSHHQQQQYPLPVNQQHIKSNNSNHQLGVQNISHKETLPQQHIHVQQQLLHQHQHPKPSQHQHQQQHLHHLQSQSHPNQQLNQTQAQQTQQQIGQANTQQHLQSMNSFGGTPVVDTGSERTNIKGQHSGQLHHSPMGTSTPYVQSFEYNAYYNRKPPQSPRSDARHQCHGYNKHLPQYQSDLLPDPGVVPSHSLLQPSFLESPEEVSMRGIEDSPADPVRYFSVSHLVSPFNDGRKSNLNQKDQGAIVNDEKSKETQNKGKNRKAENKNRTSGSNASKGSSQLAESKRSPGRSGGAPQSNNSNTMWNKNSGAQKQGHNYSAEALISSQNYVRSTHRQSVNQNYHHFMSPNQMYQSSYSSQPMKSFAQNPSFGYSGHDRSGVCNSDYNFPLHTQPSGSLSYGHNMPYMAPSYPYQNLPPTSSSMIPGDIMAPHHHPGTYPRLHDINSDHSNFTSNAAFSIPLDPQDMCGGPGLVSSNVSSMGVRSSDVPFSISSRSGLPKSNANGVIGATSTLNTGGKRPRYGDGNMVGTGMATPTNFLDGGALSHISLHSLTPPCEDASFMHSNFLGGPSRHQSNFLLSSENFMHTNSSQHSAGGPVSNVGGNVSGISSSTSNNAMSINGASNHMGMGTVPAARSAPPVLPPHAAAGHVPFNPLRMVDRQQMNMPPPVGPHLSSSLANFNLTSIIPEIDGKTEDTSSGPINSSTSQPATSLSNPPNMGGNLVSLPGQSRLHSMNASSLLPPNEDLKTSSTPASHSEPLHRIPPVINNSMNNIFPHSHQVSLGLNPSLALPTSSFAGINFAPADH